MASTERVIRKDDSNHWRTLRDVLEALSAAEDNLRFLWSAQFLEKALEHYLGTYDRLPRDYERLRSIKVEIAEAFLSNFCLPDADESEEIERALGRPIIPIALRWQVFERDNFTCLGCGSRRLLSADHIFPLSKGGQTILENLQTLCRSCNSRKGTKIPNSKKLAVEDE